MKSSIIPLLCLSFSLLSPLLAAEHNGKSLVFNLPEGAKFEDKAREKGEFYSITLQKEPGNFGLLMIHDSPVPGSKEMLKPMAEMMRVSIEQAMKENKELALKDTKTTSKEIEKGIWTGYEIQFTGTPAAGPKLLQLMYVLWDGKRMWNAQFTGQEKDYDQVVKILEETKLK